MQQECSCESVISIMYQDVLERVIISSVDLYPQQKKRWEGLDCRYNISVFQFFWSKTKNVGCPGGIETLQLPFANYF